MKKKRKMMIECIETTEGFDINQSYECLGFSSGYVEVIDNIGNTEIMPEKYFRIGKNKEKK
jgi:hypothetical protein